MNSQILVLLSLLSLVLLSHQVYISPFGNDNSGAGTEASPYRSLRKALSINDNTIYALPGIYTGVDNFLDITKTVKIIGVYGADKTKFNTTLPSYNTLALKYTGIQFVGITFDHVKFSIESYNSMKLTWINSTLSSCLFVSTASIYYTSISIQGSLIKNVDAPMQLLPNSESYEFKDTIVTGYGISLQQNPVNTLTISGGAFLDIKGTALFAAVKTAGTISNVQFLNVQGSSIKAYATSNIVIGVTGVTIEQSGGPAISCGTNAHLVVTDSYIHKNNMPALNATGCSIAVRGSIIAENHASEGAGFYCGEHGVVQLSSSKVIGNVADVAGAGQCAATCQFFIMDTVVQDNVDVTGNKGNCDWQLSNNKKLAFK